MSSLASRRPIAVLVVLAALGALLFAALQVDRASSLLVSGLFGLLLVAALLRHPGVALPMMAALSFTLPFQIGTGSEVSLSAPVVLIPLAVVAWLVDALRSGSLRLPALPVTDSRMVEATIDAIGPIERSRGLPRKRPDKLHADKGYDFPRCREALRRGGITPRIARRKIDSSERLGRHRWVVEPTLSWLNRYRRPKVRHERRAGVYQAFLSQGCALICWNSLEKACCWALLVDKPSRPDQIPVRARRGCGACASRGGRGA